MIASEKRHNSFVHSTVSDISRGSIVLSSSARCSRSGKRNDGRIPNLWRCDPNTGFVSAGILIFSRKFSWFSSSLSGVLVPCIVNVDCCTNTLMSLCGAYTATILSMIPLVFSSFSFTGANGARNSGSSCSHRGLWMVS